MLSLLLHITQQLCLSQKWSVLLGNCQTQQFKSMSKKPFASKSFSVVWTGATVGCWVNLTFSINKRQTTNTGYCVQLEQNKCCKLLYYYEILNTSLNNCFLNLYFSLCDLWKSKLNSLQGRKVEERTLMWNLWAFLKTQSFYETLRCWWGCEHMSVTRQVMAKMSSIMWFPCWVEETILCCRVH